MYVQLTHAQRLEENTRCPGLAVAFAVIEPEVRLAGSKPRQSAPVSSLLFQMMEMIQACPWTMLIFTQTLRPKLGPTLVQQSPWPAADKF